MLSVTALAVVCLVVFLRMAPASRNFTPRRTRPREAVRR